MNIEEINQAVTSDPELGAQVASAILENEATRNKAIENLSSSGYFILDKDRQSGILNEIREKGAKAELPGFLNEFAKPVTRSIHEAYERDFSGLGVKKEHNEHAYEALKRAWSENQSKIQQLQEQINAGLSDSDAKARIQEIETDAAAKIKDWQDKYNKLESDYNLTIKSNTVNGIYSELKKGFKDESQLGTFFKTHEKQVLETASKNSKKEGDVWYMTDADGNILKDENYNGVTVESYLKNEFKDAVKTGTPSGGGTGGGREKTIVVDPNTISVSDFRLDPKVTNESLLIDELVSIGLVQGTPKFTEFFSHFRKQLNK